ncbi:MAG TPA: asparagine synthase-related protein [Polyangia bacterium]|nr:asparagine synthase-related protein [Polyangia bacterium]
MSIIAGAVDWTGARRAPGDVREMLATFRRESPDGLKVKERDVCALGLGLLSTTRSDPDTEGLTEAPDLLVALDGHLADVDHLRSTLGLDGTSSEVNVVAEGFRRWDVELFSRLKGDFAVIFWHAETRRLIAARDPFAVRPLFYSDVGQRFALASDPEQLLRASLVSAVPDDDVVLDYLLWDMRFPDRSFFRDIRALPAGHFVVGANGSHSLRRYRAACLTSQSLSDRSSGWEQYRVAFDRAIRRCIDSPRAVVAELSGGLDSSSIVCAADRLLAAEPSICPDFVGAAALFPGLDCDEEPFIRAVADHVRVPVECWDSTDIAVNELEDVTLARPGARFFLNGGSEGQVDIARRHGARVILSGIGGDQTGMPSGGLRDAVTESRWSDAARILIRRPSNDVSKTARSVWRLAKSFAPAPVRRLRASMRSREERPPWLTGWARNLPRPRPRVAMPEELGGEIHRNVWHALSSGTHAQMMAFAQHHAIRSAIELRFPFLSSDVISVVLSIPARFWPPPWPGERLHRGILRNILPQAVIQRRSKANFSSALAARVRRHLPAIRDIFASSNWASEQFVDRAAARRALSVFESSKTPSFWTTYAVWGIATLETWLDAILRYPLRQPSRTP